MCHDDMISDVARDVCTTTIVGATMTVIIVTVQTTRPHCEAWSTKDQVQGSTKPPFDGRTFTPEGTLTQPWHQFFVASNAQCLFLKQG